MRRLAYVLLIASATFLMNAAILFWAYDRMVIPYLIEPELNENVPRMLHTVMMIGVAAVLTSGLAAFVLRSTAQPSQK